MKPRRTRRNTKEGGIKASKTRNTGSVPLQVFLRGPSCPSWFHPETLQLFSHEFDMPNACQSLQMAQCGATLIRRKSPEVFYRQSLPLAPT